MSQQTRQFFDDLSADYTAAIERCAPRYREMLWAILHYLPSDLQPGRILELGCGTGNLSQVVAKTWPNAEVHLLDISGELLKECRQRLGEDERLHYVEADFGLIDFEPGSFDLITSSIAIHHLPDGGKRRLFASIHRWLAPGGWLAFSDQFSATTTDAYQKHIDAWHEQALQLGSSNEDWQRWMQHQDEHDHHATLTDQIDWLRAAGFHLIDCPWRYLLWTVLTARK